MSERLSKKQLKVAGNRSSPFPVTKYHTSMEDFAILQDLEQYKPSQTGFTGVLVSPQKKDTEEFETDDETDTDQSSKGMTGECKKLEIRCLNRKAQLVANNG